MKLPSRNVIILLFALLFTLSPLGIPDDAGAAEDSGNETCGRSFLVKEIPFSFPSPSMLSDGDGVHVNIEGVAPDPRPTALELPRKTYEIELPVGSGIIAIEIDDPDTEYMDVPGRIARNPEALPNGDLSLWEGSDEEIPAPDRHLEYHKGTGLDLDTGETVMKLALSLYPAIPVNGRLSFMGRGTIRIIYEAPAAPLAEPGEEFDMLIICPDQFRERVDEYALYRNQTGIWTRVVTLSDITEDRIWNITGSDLQEEMKLFVYNARLNWSINSLLLVGDVNVMPAREIMVLDNYDDNNGHTDGRFLPSDLYFADLFEGGTVDFCSWNDYDTGGHDLLYGEYISGNRDGVDIYPDVTVGRIPAGSLSELDLMLTKAKTYELTAKGSDWFYNATLCGTNTFTQAGHGDTSGISEGEYMSDLIAAGPLSGFNSTRHFESLGNLTNIASTVNRGCGFFEMSDHGNYNGWGYTSLVSPAVSSTLAYGLDNGNELPIAVLDACLTHGFDNENASDPITGKDPVYGQYYYPPGASFAGRDCLGEYFHKAPNGGAVATYGCTRVGYGSFGSSYAAVNSGFMNYHIHKAYSDGFTRTGEMLAKALEDYMGQVGPNGAASFKTLTEYVLLGDPSLTVGGVDGANVNIDSNVTEMEILPSETLNIGLNLTNTGFLSTSVSLHPILYGSPAEGWNISVEPENGTLAPDEVLNVTLNVTAPGQIRMGTIQNIGLEVYSPLMTRTRSFTIELTVGRTWGLAGESDPPTHSTFQGSRISGHLNVSNMGNGPETLNISGWNLPDGWELILPEGPIEVPPYEEERIPYQMVVPSPFLAGSYDVELRISSDTDPASCSIPLSVEIRVEHGLTISTDQGRVDLLPGNRAAFTVHVSNTGNAIVNVSLGWGRTDLPGWGLGMETPDLSMEPFSNRDVMVWMDVPDGTPPLTYKVYLNATDGVVSRTTSVYINVSRVYNYTVICPVTSAYQNGTGMTNFNITIFNGGNIYDVYTISSQLPGGWTFSPSVRDASIDAGKSRSIRVSYANLFPLEGSYNITLTIAPRSVAPPTTFDLVIIVPPIYDFGLDAEVEKGISFPGEVMSGSLIITSASNCEDTFSIGAVLPEFLLLDIPRTIILGPGETSSVNFSIMPTTDALAGDYPVTFSATSTGSGLDSSVVRSFHVAEVYDVEIRLVKGITGELEPGGIYELLFRVENRGNAPDRVETSLLCPGYIRGWIRLENGPLVSMEPGENLTIRVLIEVPSFNVSGGIYNISLAVSSFGDRLTTGNISLDVKDSRSIDDGNDIPWNIIIPFSAVGTLVILICIIGALLFIRRHSGEDLEELGMEWEEEEEDEWDDDEEFDWDDE